MCVQGVESTFVPYDRYKYRSRAQLQMIPASEPITISIDPVKEIFLNGQILMSFNVN